MGEKFGYRQLRVWQDAMTLVEFTFQITKGLPEEQRFCLASQMQRASVSIPSNIAEGHAKRSSKDYNRHLKIAAGSLAELETQLELTVRLGFAKSEDIRPAWAASQRVARMLSRLIGSISSKSSVPIPTANAKPRKPR
jgi:four helix bundle protein